MKMEDARKKKINTLIVAVASGFFCLTLAGQMIFPTFRYRSQPLDDFDKIVVRAESLKTGSILAVAPLFDYPFHSVTLKLEKDPAGKAIGGNLSVSKGYFSQHYPQGNPISDQQELEKLIYASNPAGLASGSLVSRGESVFLVSRGKAHAFLDPRIFVKLGFDWGKVRPIGGEDFSQLEKGDSLDFNSVHPEGVIFQDGEGRIFLVGKRELRPIQPAALLEKVWPDRSVVKIEKQGMAEAGRCEKTKENESEYRCKLKNPRTDLTGDSFLFVPREGGNISLRSAEVEFSLLGNFDPSVARKVLAKMKEDLYLRYYQYWR